MDLNGSSVAISSRSAAWVRSQAHPTPVPVRWPRDPHRRCGRRTHDGRLHDDEHRERLGAASRRYRRGVPMTGTGTAGDPFVADGIVDRRQRGRQCRRSFPDQAHLRSHRRHAGADLESIGSRRRGADYVASATRRQSRQRHDFGRRSDRRHQRAAAFTRRRSPSPAPRSTPSVVIPRSTPTRRVRTSTSTAGACRSTARRLQVTASRCATTSPAPATTATP